MESTEDAPAPQATLPSVQQFFVDVVEGPGAGTRWASESDRCAIGSHESNDLVVNDKTVSRFHCEILIDARGLTVRDLGSRNRTVLDGVEVVQARLREASTLRLGTTTVRVSVSTALNPLPMANIERFGLLVGRSPAMQTAFYRMQRAAASDATVLIHGETGTGKDLAAESVHQASVRSTAPFVIVDCGSIPSQLMEAELFGHERGAFTGAVAGRPGAFEAGEGGTVFLDEIGELPLELQPKLLRVLDKRTVQRLGSTDRHTVNVRVIAATNRDLRAAVNEGAFRADLYYRLSVLAVRMPPLRERPEDLPELARAIFEELGADEAQLRELLSEDLIARLARSAWPGNVRELRNYLEQCMVMAKSEPLPVSEFAVTSAIPPPAHLPFRADESYAAYRRRVGEDLDRQYLTWLLRQHGGNVTQAARAAKLSRMHLHRLMRRAGVAAERG